MRRRSHLAILLIALLMVGASVVPSTPRDSAQAADPLADAKAEQKALEKTLSAQRAALSALKMRSAKLTKSLAAAKAQLATVSAEYDLVYAQLEEVKGQVAEITARLADLRGQIAALDEQLAQLTAQIQLQSAELAGREALLEEHMRSAYERSQTSLLELILSSESLDSATTQVGYLLTISEQDQRLAGEIRQLRESVRTKQDTAYRGRVALAATRDQADAEAQLLADRQAELTAMEAELAKLKAAAEQNRRQQADALNAALEARGNVAAEVAAAEKAAQAQALLVARLQAEEDARRQQPSAFGFRWPEDTFHITQNWGPTTFLLEGPYTYRGTYYPHFHGGIDLANGCGTPIRAVGSGTVQASGRPLWPWDSGYGVVISHGSGVLSWYWHLKAQVIVSPGQQVSLGQVIGYEGNTGNSTGCHLHFAINDHGIWENPRVYLP